MRKLNSYFNIRFSDGKLTFIDQRKLPFSEEYITTGDYKVIAEAIKNLAIRGAPAIGVAAAYGLALSVQQDDDPGKFEDAFYTLINTRPTAVNLSYALKRVKKACENSTSIYQSAIAEAGKIFEEDVIMCDKMAENGIVIFGDSPKTVLTHCNTGKLAVAGEGTAFAVIKFAFSKGLVNMVYADETRPLLQGSRLTAFELSKNNIPFKIINDSSAAWVMKNKKVDLVITGADRIASNGDSANKIGTYSLAILCKHHNIPFYIAAPSSTIDINTGTGKQIIIEERDSSEITSVSGKGVTLSEYEVFNPAFDVTPAQLISGIITESGLFTFPYNFK
ncbi:MAG: S-methyl-5-thioribose-1-phosphate isomerase [Ignavibacteriaceae bacterium]|nr:S-methyl-5-thioribose-1-phosphate isomerase [Ignavibacteriaceae bacterium]